MKTRIGKWGNRLGLRIPKVIAGRLGLTEGARVDIETDGERIVISRSRPHYRLPELLKGMNRKAMGKALDREWDADI